MYACGNFPRMPRSEKKILFSDSLLECFISERTTEKTSTGEETIIADKNIRINDDDEKSPLSFLRVPVRDEILETILMQGLMPS